MLHTKVYSPYNRSWMWVIATALLTTIFSQIYFIPFNEGHLRFGLGPVIFLLLLLIHRIPAIPTAILTAAFVLLHRAGLFIILENYTVLEALWQHIPSGIYYLIYGTCLHYIPFDRIKQHPLIIGLLVSTGDIGSNLIEHIIGFLLIHDPQLTLSQTVMIIVICAGRAFAIIGVYGATVIHTQQKQIEEMLALDSNLYVESLYLQKAMNEIEQLTSQSYDMYRDLKDKNLRQESMQALMLAQEIHEVKKDTERIFAGITKMMLHKETTHYTMDNVLHFVTTANGQYADLLNKDILLEVSSNKNIVVQRITPIMAVLNNLLSNAIEAIEQRGHVTLHVDIHSEATIFTVTDNGPGISEETAQVIFEPGFTTKFNTEGVASTGIGLSHVQEILNRLEGSITVHSQKGKTTFTIMIPTKYIQKEEN